jgi:hypothetical protein
MVKCISGMAARRADGTGVALALKRVPVVSDRATPPQTSRYCPDVAASWSRLRSDGQAFGDVLADELWGGGALGWNESG